jgi:hypothetical protein
VIGVGVQEVLVAVQKWSRSAMREQGFAVNNCIHATRTLQDVLMHFGYFGRPLTVWAYVHNPPLWRAIKARAEAMAEGRPAPAVPEQTDPEYDKLGFWGLGVQKGNPGGGWDGHLVLYVEHDDLPEPIIIDGSFDQFARPEKKIIVPQKAVLITVPEDFATESQQAAFETPTGVGVIYESKPRDHTYVRAPDWMQYAHRPLYLKVRDTIIRAVESEVRST